MHNGVYVEIQIRTVQQRDEEKGNAPARLPTIIARWQRKSGKRTPFAPCQVVEEFDVTV
jgi:hypothetical protein